MSIPKTAKQVLAELQEVSIRNAQFRKDMYQAIEQEGKIVWRGRTFILVDQETGLQSHIQLISDRDAKNIESAT